MKLEPGSEATRSLNTRQLECDLAVIGGGLSGTCCAITAARAGLKVVLVQDRPVLGGNASSEVRLWALGATAHMGNNNRWAREGGVIGEILVENIYRNPEGNSVIFDTIILEKAVQEPSLTLLLNTATYEVIKSDADTIQAVHAFCGQNSTRYTIFAPRFVDASGDGVVGFLAGAAFRMGAEKAREFNEKLAPSDEYGELLGHSIYFYTKDVGRPVRFVPPSYALDDITKIPRYKSFNTQDDGCRLWWIEYGGRLDTIHDTEQIKWELWKVVYGVWNYIKNSGHFPEAETWTLDWVGLIPGKRESRRFEGDYMLRQQDIVEQRQHPDAVAYGGWALDLHPADGIYSEKPGCNQWHSRGVYQIPFRIMYSRNIKNLFLAGRIISASHVAFGSTRVMLTVSHAAQAVGVAAALCRKYGVMPAQLDNHMNELQRELLRRGQFIPEVPLDDPNDLARQATIRASSSLTLRELPDDGPLLPLDYSWAQMVPLEDGQEMPAITFCVDARKDTTLRFELRTSDRPANHTPNVTLARQTIHLPAGKNQHVTFSPKVIIDDARYVFACLMKNSAVSVHTSTTRITGLLSVANAQNPKVSNYGKQEPVEEIGVETFEFWVPLRRPGGHNLAFMLSEPLTAFRPENVTNGWGRPTHAPNAWVAELVDEDACIELAWEHPQTIAQLNLVFDTDFDHPMETVLMGHPEREMTFCVRSFVVEDTQGNILAKVNDNHQSLRVLHFEPPVQTDRLHIRLIATNGTPPALFAIGCYSEDVTCII